MKPLTPLIVVGGVMLLGALSSCAGPDHGAASYLGAAPFKIRHQEVSPSGFYVEVLGNGFANPEMLERHFLERAKELCGGEPAEVRSLRGHRYPDARLPEVRHEGCMYGRFCNRTEASLPLVYGAVRCKDPMTFSRRFENAA